MIKSFSKGVHFTCTEHYTNYILSIKQVPSINCIEQPLVANYSPVLIGPEEMLGSLKKYDNRLP